MGSIHQALFMRSGGGAAVPTPGNVVLLLGADEVPTAGGTPRWWDGLSGGTPTTSSTPTDVHSLAFNNTGAGAQIITLPTSTTTPALGIRIYVTSDTSGLIARFRDNSTGEHFDIRYIAGGNFRVSANNGTLNVTSTGGHITLNTQFYLTFSGIVANSPGGSYTCKLYSNALALLETIGASGIDTQEGSNPATTAVFGGYVGYYEDAWVDLDGEDHGPCQVETSVPTGAGDLAQLTRSGSDSGANWSQVDEIPVGTSDAVVSTGADQYDCYTFANRSVTGTPIATGVAAACVATSGTVNFNFICRIGGVTYEHPLTHTMTTTPEMFGGYWQNNPATSAAWTDAQINAAQFGIHIHATNGSVRGLYRETLVQL